MQQCYICACLKNGKSVKLRQSAPYSAIFVDEDGNAYHTTEVDFTNVQVDLQNVKDNGKIRGEERDCRIKLRYDIFSLLFDKADGGYYAQCDDEMLDDVLRRTEKIFDELYSQDAKFSCK